MRDAYTPTGSTLSEQVGRIFDFRINLVAILALGGIVFGAATGVSRFETKETHDADIKAVQLDFVRKDVNAVTDRELREWMMRMEAKVDQLQRDWNTEERKKLARP